MPALARRQIVDDRECGAYHCISRCVRRAWLCGRDPVTGRDYEHRRKWIQQKLQELAAIFAMKIHWLAILANHLHLLIRNRPDIARRWSSEEVIRRAVKAFPWKFKELGIHGEPIDQQIDGLVWRKELVAEMRKRLCSISWFMRSLCQSIARRANKEDDVTGHFFEGRYRSVPLLSESAVLSCGMYIDLNPIRAGESETPETSRFTSAYHRIQGRLARQQGGADAADRDGWLAPISDDGDAQQYFPPAPDLGARRISDEGLLPISVDRYLELLDWTGRQIQQDKRGAIPAHLAPILQRVGVKSDAWLVTVHEFGRRFRVAAGSTEQLAEFASRIGRNRLNRRELAERVFG